MKKRVIYKYIVYKTTNLINGKIYIGVHRTNPDIFDGYIGCGVECKGYKKKNPGFPAAVIKYGYENFKRETLFEYPDSDLGREQAYAKEAELVNIEFVKRRDTYNLMTGGKHAMYIHSRKIAQYTLEGKFLRVWDSIQEAKEKMGLTSIIGNLKCHSKYCGNYQWRYYNEDDSDIDPVQTKERTVYQFDLQGNLLKVYQSVSEAAKQFKNPKSAKVAISNNCCKRTKQSFGYYWSYTNKFEFEINKHLAAVAKYNDEGVFLESYSSIKEAADANGIKTPPNIIAAIKGSQKRCGGFRWRYFYGNKDNIKPLK